jgi:hypothetical protein
MQMPRFKGVLNAYPLSNHLVNGTTDDRPGIRKKGCVCVEAQDAYNNVVTQGYLVFNRVVPRVFSSSRGPGLMRKPGKGR